MDAVVQSAELHACSIEAARECLFRVKFSYNSPLYLDASAEFAPINLTNALEAINHRLDNISVDINCRLDNISVDINHCLDNVNHRLDLLGNQFDSLSAVTYNTQTVTCNVFRSTEQPYLPLKKWVCMFRLIMLVCHDILSPDCRRWSSTCSSSCT